MIPHKLLVSKECPNTLTKKDLVYIGILASTPIGGDGAALARIKDGEFSDILANMTGVRTPFDRNTSLRPYIAANHAAFLAIPNRGYSASSSSGGSSTALQMYTTTDYGDSWEEVPEVSGQEGLAASTLSRVEASLQVAWNEDLTKGIFYTLGYFIASSAKSSVMLSLDGKNWTVYNGNFASVAVLYRGSKAVVLYKTISGGLGCIFYSVTEDSIALSKSANLTISSGVPSVVSYVPLGTGMLLIPTSGSAMYVEVDWDAETISKSSISVPSSLVYAGGDYAGHSYNSFLRTVDPNKVGIIFPDTVSGKEFLVELSGSSISVEEKSFITSYSLMHNTQGGAIVGGPFWQAYPNIVCLEDLSEGLYPPKCMTQKLPVPEEYTHFMMWAAMPKQ